MGSLSRVRGVKLSPAVSIAVCSALAALAPADTLKWSPTAGASPAGVDGSGNWDLTLPYWYNQTAGTAGQAWTNGNFASFGGGTAGTYTVTLGSAITASGIAFTNNSYTVAGGTGPYTLTLGGGVDVAGNPVNFNAGGTGFPSQSLPGPAVNTGSTSTPVSTVTGYATINATLAGTSGLTKTGNGFLQLGGTNSTGLSGGAAINGGGLVISSAANLAAGTVTVGAGAVSATSVNSSNIGFLSVTGTGDVSLGNAFALPTTASTTYYTLGKSGTGSLLTLSGALTGGSSTTWLMFNTPTGGDGLTRLVLTGNNSGYTGNVRINRGSITLGNANALGSGQLYLQTNGGNAAGNLTFGGAFTLSNAIVFNSGGNGSPTVNTGTNAVTLTGALSGNGGFVKIGPGTLTVTGSGNTVTGGVTVTAGTLALDGSGSLPSANVLTLGGGGFGGGTLALTATKSTAQTFASTTLNAGGNAISNAGTGALALGAITRNIGAAVDVAPGTGGVTTTSVNTNGILGGYATANAGAAFATVSSTNIIPLAAGTTTSTLGNTAAGYAGVNVDVDSSPTLDAAATPNSLRFNTAAARTLTLTGTNAIQSGGILNTAVVAGNTSTITGGTLTGPAAGGDLTLHQYNTAGGLTINSTVANGTAATNLVKTGPGLVTLGGTNTYTGGTSINAGTVAFTNGSALGTGAITVGATANNGATGVASGNTAFLRYTGSATGVALANNIALPAPTSAAVYTITQPGSSPANSAGAQTVSLNGIISGGNANSVLQINTQTASDYASITQLTGSNTYAGTTQLNRGSLFIGNASALGTSSLIVQTNPNYSGQTVQTAYGNVTFTSPLTVTNNIQFNTDNDSFYNATGNDVTLSGVVSGTAIIQKLGGGNLTLSGANSSSGNLVINAGTLTAGTAASASPGSSTSPIGQLTSSRTVTVAGGATLVLGRNNVLGNSVASRPVLAISGTTSSSAYNALGSVQLNGGTLTSTTAATTGYGSYALEGTVTAGGTATSTISNPTAGAAGINLGSNTSFVVNDVTAGVDLTVSTPLLNRSNDFGGNGGFTKSGAGTMAVTAASTYAGATTITAGTLRADNSTSSLGSGPVSVRSTGVLAGGSSTTTGRTGNGAATVGNGTAAGGTITAGTGATSSDTVGTLATGDQTWNGLGSTSGSGGTYAVKFDTNAGTLTPGVSHDVLAMGMLSITSNGGLFTIKMLKALGGTFDTTQSGTYTIARATSVAVNGVDQTGGANLTSLFYLDASGIDLPDNTGLTVTLAGNAGYGSSGGFDINLSYSAAPEPTTAALVALGGSAVLGRRRRRAVSAV